MTKTRGLLQTLAASLVYALIVILVDVGLLFVFLRDINLILYPLQIASLTEGGIGLIIGGLIGSSSPSIAKIEEALFHTKLKRLDQQKDAQKRAKLWILTGVFLVIIALFLPAV
jgi:hypothetical protein